MKCLKFEYEPRSRAPKASPEPSETGTPQKHSQRQASLKKKVPSQSRLISTHHFLSNSTSFTIPTKYTNTLPASRRNQVFSSGDNLNNHFPENKSDEIDDELIISPNKHFPAPQDESSLNGESTSKPTATSTNSFLIIPSQHCFNSVPKHNTFQTIQFKDVNFRSRTYINSPCHYHNSQSRRMTDFQIAPSSDHLQLRRGEQEVNKILKIKLFIFLFFIYNI